MEKKEGTHLVFSGKVCGREEKRFDGECGNFPNRLCCSTAAVAAFPGCCAAAPLLDRQCGPHHVRLCKIFRGMLSKHYLSQLQLKESDALVKSRHSNVTLQ